MSSKTKGLQYQANEPAFLQRLRAQNGGEDGRHETPIARPKRAKVDDEEDAPAYVMEDSNDTLSKAEYEKLMAKESGIEEDDVGRNVTGTTTGDGPYMSGALGERTKATDEPHESKLGQKKRKVAAVIRQDEDEDEEPAAQPKPKKTKKKAKAINVLSFDDNEE